MEFVTPYFQEYQQTIWAATKDLHEAKPEVRVTCDSAISNAPSKWFGDITKNFCPLANKSELGTGSIAYDVYGNKIPLLKNKVATKTPIEGRSLLYERTPPEYQENYKDYKFFVSWEPAKGDCVLPKDTMCVDAYKKAVQTNCEFHSPPPPLSPAKPCGPAWLTSSRQAAATTARRATGSSSTPSSTSAAASTRGTSRRRASRTRSRTRPRRRTRSAPTSTRTRTCPGARRRRGPTSAAATTRTR